MSRRFSSSGQNVIQISQCCRARGRDAPRCCAVSDPAGAQRAIRRRRPEMRIQRLENQLRQLTGQNEELQYRNRQLEERLRQLGGGAGRARWPAPGRPAQRGRCAAASPAQPNPPPRQPQGAAGYPQAQPGLRSSRRSPRPRPIVQDPAAPPAAGPPPRRCLRSQPEPQRPRRAARARRRPDADRQ